MKSIRIYQPGKFEVGKSFHLDKTSSHHLIKVLRLKNNFSFNLFNGEGDEFIAKLEISGKSTIAHIETKLISNNESSLHTHLIQGISKGDRMDFAIQKSIELGVHSITPVITERTVVNLKDHRTEKKLQHWQSVAISACEQSGRSTLPIINPICTLADILKQQPEGLKILLDPLSENSFHSLTASNNIQILIGPEGGLSDNEITDAIKYGFKGVRLGPRILRTETAALAAIASAQLLWGDLN